MIVFRSDNTEVLAHHAEAEEANARWKAAVDKAREDLGFTGNTVLTLNRVTGFEHHGDPPRGWRRHWGPIGNVAVTPDERFKVGKQAAARLRTLVRPDPRDKLPGGMPGEVLDGSRLFSPSYALMAGAVYVAWSYALPAEEAERIDPAVWQQIKLSEYYAVCEAEGREQA